MFRRSLLERILPLPVAVTQSPDTCLRNAALALEKGWYQNEPLSIMRIHGNNARFKARPIISFSQAAWLKDKFPILRLLANKIFSRGLSNYWKDRKHDEICEKNIKTYLSQVSLSEHFLIVSRAAYYFLQTFYIERSL